MCVMWWELAPAPKAAGTGASRYNELRGRSFSLLERRTGWEMLTLAFAVHDGKTRRGCLQIKHKAGEQVSLLRWLLDKAQGAA